MPVFGLDSHLTNDILRGGGCSSALSLRIDCNNWRHHRAALMAGLCNERQTCNNVQLSAETEPCFILAFHVRWKVLANREGVVDVFMCIRRKSLEKKTLGKGIGRTGLCVLGQSDSFASAMSQLVIA